LSPDRRSILLRNESATNVNSAKEKKTLGWLETPYEMTAKALRAAGMLRLDAVEWRVVNALAEDGIFQVGSALVGTTSYRCIVNLLGVKFLSATAVTADVDIAWKSDTFRQAI
jgi:hypothetical protein